MHVPKSPFFHPSSPNNFRRAAALRRANENEDNIELGRQADTTTTATTSFTQKQQQQHKPEAKSTLTGCTANLMNAIVGSGIVGIAYSIQQAGLVAGCVLIGLTAWLTAASLQILIGTAKHAHTATYECVAEAAFGTTGYVFVALSMFVMAYGAMLSYLMIVKDSLSTVLLYYWPALQQEWDPKVILLLLTSLTIQVPLACQRDMANLAWTSQLSVGLDTILVGLVAYNAFFWNKDDATTQTVNLPQDSVLDYSVIDWTRPDFWIRPDTIFVGIGVLSFAFVCQHSAFIIAGSLERPTSQRWGTVTVFALTACALLAWTAGLSGYVGYGETVQGNVLNNLDDTSWTANLARCLLGTTMLFVYPVESFVARHVCVTLLFQGRRAHEGNDDADLLQRADRRIGLTVALYILAVVPACLLDNLGSVLAITGAIGGSCLAYIGPGMVYLGIHGESFWKFSVDSQWIGAVAKLELEKRKTWEKERRRRRLDVLPTPAGFVVETTPLVKEKADSSATAGTQVDTDVQFCGKLLVQRMLWYTCAMPFWTRIAWYGKNNLSRHMHSLALKSPHPLRIGDVEYKRVVATPPSTNPNRFLRRSNDTTTKTSVLGRSLSSVDRKGAHATQSHSNAHAALLRESSLPADNNFPLKSLNQQIGQMLRQRQHDIEQQQTEPLEQDPQASPAASDFATAIFLITFGILAFCAGLVSIVQETERDE